jgi:hypothetical protein
MYDAIETAIEVGQPHVLDGTEQPQPSGGYQVSCFPLQTGRHAEEM